MWDGNPNSVPKFKKVKFIPSAALVDMGYATTKSLERCSLCGNMDHAKLSCKPLYSFVQLSGSCDLWKPLE